jgi:hypothetical protein
MDRFLGPTREAVALTTQEVNYWQGIVKSSVYPYESAAMSEELARVEHECPPTFTEVMMHRFRQFWRD